VSKTFLISHLQSGIGSGALKFVPTVIDADELKRQLCDLQGETLSSGALRIEASAGNHDDLVIAVAIALFASHHVNQQTFEAVPITWG
jgi:hypothetical protein